MTDSKISGDNTSTSIGIVGVPYFDPVNDRVKYFPNTIYESPGDVVRAFSDTHSEMRDHDASRMTLRVIVPNEGKFIRGLYDRLHNVRIFEGDIPLNGNFKGNRIMYMGLNKHWRYSPDDVLFAERDMVQDVLDTERRLHHVPDGFAASRLTGTQASRQDIEDLVALYNEALTTYLFDLNHENVAGMLDATDFAVIRNDQGRIVSAAAAEHGQLDIEGQGHPMRFSEMSEMATFRNYRGLGLNNACAQVLMETLTSDMDMIYAEGRSNHLSINRVLHGLGMYFGGRLNKHCVISGDHEIEEKGPFENLNVWYYKW